MGRTRLAKANIEELRQRIRESEKHKKKFVECLQKLKNRFLDKEISYFDYQSIAGEKVDGKTAKEWINYHDSYAENCRKLISNEERKIFRNKIVWTIFSLIGISVLVFMLFNTVPNLVGLIVQENVQEFTENVNLKFDEPANYEWEIKNAGELRSLKISGVIEGKGDVKIYLDDLLILDGNELGKKSKGITGEVISVEEEGSIWDFLKRIFGFGIAGRAVDETDSSDSEPSSDSESDSSSESNAETSSNDEGESQSVNDESDDENRENENEIADESIEESAADEDIEDEDEIADGVEENIMDEENVGGNVNEDDVDEENGNDLEGEIEVNETESSEEINESNKDIINETESSEESINEQKKEKQEVKFESFCAETCELKNLRLNKSSYILRIEINNAQVRIDEIIYEILFSEEGAPQNTSPSQEEPPISELNETKLNETEISERNETTNQTEVMNLTGVPKLIKEIPEIKIEKNGFVDVNLAEYFENAEIFFLLQVKNISSTTFDHTLRLTADTGFEGIQTSKIIASNSLGQAESNFFNISVETKSVNVTNVTFNEVNVSTLQYKAIINRPQKWIKVVKADRTDDIHDLVLELPKEAKNISVKTGIEVEQALREINEYSELIENAADEEIASGFITGNVALDLNRNRNLFEKFFRWLMGFGITGNVIQEEELSAEIVESAGGKEIDIGKIANRTKEKEIAVEYYTSGPISEEELIKRGKRVRVYNTDEENYTDVLAFAEIPEILDVGQEGRIKVYWREENKYINFSASDLNSDRKLDYVEWIVPHLSNQSFDIILIVEAEHLDENREFISDIFEDVRELDGNWSEEIPNTHYVRVVFERNLTSDRDISIYARKTTGNPRIEVYEFNGTEIIAELSSLTNNEYNKILLDGSSGAGLDGEQDTFDLRIVGGGIEIEHIIDPSQLFFEDCSTGAITDQWSPGNWIFGTGGNAGWCLGPSRDQTTMTSIAIDLTNALSATLSFNYENVQIEGSADWLKVWVNSSVEGDQLLLTNQNNTPASVTFNLENSITLTTGVHIKAECKNNGNGENCRWDNINITATYDETAPTANLLSPSNGSNVTESNNTFSASVFDSVNVTNATLHIYNSTGVLIGNNFTIVGVGGSLTVNIPYNLNYTDVFSWNVLAYDSSGNNAFASSNFSLNYSNAVPQITQAYNNTIDLSAGPNEGPSSTNVVINFTAFDLNGFGDLNDSTASVNFTESKGTGVRESASCTRYQSGGNYANYTCNVTMWWFDSSGTWDITAYIEDNQADSAQNDSTDFFVGLRTAFTLGPSALTWPGLAPGATNQTSNNDPLVLNNTGNDDIAVDSVEVNATNLLGESDSIYGLWAGNFSVSTFTGGLAECNASATILNSSIYTNITGASLPAGNYTQNDGTAQEELYLCLRIIGSELTTQSYSTSTNGAWTVRVLAVLIWVKSMGIELTHLVLFTFAVSYRGRKRGRGRKERTNATIPTTIFTKELGMLEATVKYLKENLGMSYHKIAELLERDERTIWTAYNKSIKKMKEQIKVKETDIFIPVSIFNGNLTVLESVIVYLKEKGLTYSEIAKLLDRDQRNVWTIYSKAVKKTKG